MSTKIWRHHDCARCAADKLRKENMSNDDLRILVEDLIGYGLDSEIWAEVLSARSVGIQHLSDILELRGLIPKHTESDSSDSEKPSFWRKLFKQEAQDPMKVTSASTVVLRRERPDMYIKREIKRINKHIAKWPSGADFIIVPYNADYPDYLKNGPVINKVRQAVADAGFDYEDLSTNNGNFSKISLRKT